MDPKPKPQPKLPIHKTVRAADVAARFDELLAAGARLDAAHVGPTPPAQAALEEVLTLRKRLIASLESAARVGAISDEEKADLALLKGRRLR